MVTPADLRPLRENSGLSIRELAGRAGVAPSTIWRIETGRLDPTVGMLERLVTVARSEPTEPVTREATVSLALGRLAAAELLRDPERILAKARRRVDATRSQQDLPRGARRWLDEWCRILDGPLEVIVAALIDPSERGYELRQNTPFTGLLSNEDRLAAIRRATGDHGATRSA